MAVAASGGRDSTALLHCAVQAARRLGVRIVALHVHHGLQPQADDWLAHLSARCRRWARQGWPVSLQVHRIRSAPPRGASVEAWARRERYAALAAMAREAGCGEVWLAHHRRDQAETVLLQLLRGGGAAARSAMDEAVERDGLVWCRPWLDQPREAIEAYLRRHRLTHVDDASNDDPRFDRNRLRLQVWPALVAAFPQAEHVLADAARRAGGEAGALRELAVIDGADAAALVRAPWLGLSAARRENVLRHWLAARGGAPAATDALVQRLLREWPAARSGARWPVAGSVAEVAAYRDRLLWRGADDGTAAPTPPAGEPAEPVGLDLSRPGLYLLPHGWGALRVERCRAGGIAAQRLAAASVRARRGTDRFAGADAALPRSLKKQFQAAGVPAWRRGGPVVADSDGAILFVAGLDADARARAPRGADQRRLVWLPNRANP